MQRYNKGDKVKTIDFWNNGFGTVIPKGSIVTVIRDTGAGVICKYNNNEPYYEYEWLGEVVSGSVKTNADKIRNMSDEELADWLNSQYEYSSIMGWQHDSTLLDWLQSEVEQE